MIAYEEISLKMIGVFELAKRLRLEREGFSITFYGFSPGWGKVDYETKCVRQEKRFNDLEELKNILESL